MLDLIANERSGRGAPARRGSNLPPLALLEVPVAVLPDEPPLTIEEDAGRLRIMAELPDWSADQLEVSLAEGVLRIRGERPGSEGPSFDRVLELTAPVDPRTGKAIFAQGRLTVTLHKLPTGTRRIPVSAGSS